MAASGVLGLILNTPGKHAPNERMLYALKQVKKEQRSVWVSLKTLWAKPVGVTFVVAYFVKHFGH